MSTFNDLIRSKELVLVDFSAEWCGPCKMQAPILKELASQVPTDKVKIIKIDVDRNQELAARMNISGVPTLVLYKNGQQVWRQSGMMPLHGLKQLINSYLN
ncbi:thioredoxin [Thermaurantimonas aggregans]|uniref:Thioredoxin n=1 Tax=Thermaurantimonas aggregans TaxID=2173829 RepID=A0A401XL64_9FLAO|nr:thioredoxin [Thermaurantimonas aggregans]MCX8149711.1 thioredoxin [Thermaurantimonas aggregans]GCD77721.1 thioredoxin [Thermaurantimonas aggregans]